MINLFFYKRNFSNLLKNIFLVVHLLNSLEAAKPFVANLIAGAAKVFQ